MERPPEPLSSRQHRLLVELVRRRAPSLLQLATTAVNRRWLTDDEAAGFSQVALDEFLEHLGPDSEPDREGVAADDLMGDIEKQRRGFWEP
jgi:hypothetical protein